MQIATGGSNTIQLLWANENTQIQDLIWTYATDADPFTPNSSTSFPETEFENLSGTASQTPRMAIDAGGNIDVVWMGDFQQNGAPQVVYFSRGSNSGSFSDPKPLTTPPPTGALASGFPQIAIEEPSGAIDVVWQQASAANPGAAYDIVLARSTDGLNFKQFTLDNAPTLAANTGQIAADGSGNVYAAWLGSSGSGGDILLNGDSTALTTPPPPPPFSVNEVTASVSPSSAVINVGGSANFAVSLSSTNSVPGSVGLACSVPVGMICSFSPGSVNLAANGGASTTLTIAVSAKPSTSAAQRNPGGPAGSRPEAMSEEFEGRVWGLGVVVFLVMLIAARHEDSRLARCARAVAWNLILAAAVTAMVSCGGSTSSSGGGGTGGGGGGGGGSSMTVPVVVQAQSNSATMNLQTISITVP